MKSTIKKINISKVFFFIFIALMFSFGSFNSVQALHVDGCSETSNGHNCDEWYIEGWPPTYLEHVTCRNNDDSAGDYVYASGKTYRVNVIRGNVAPPAGWGDECTIGCDDASACGSCECRCQGKNLYCADVFPNSSGSTVSQSCKVTANSSKCIPTAKIDSSSVSSGTCGTRNTNYAYNVSSWPSGSTYCSSSTQSTSPGFPAQGSSVSWNCTNGNVSFSGSGTDPSGNSVSEYRWVIRTHANNAAGDFSQDITFNTQSFSTNLNPNSYYVFLATKLTTGAWSSWVYKSITVSSASCSASRDAASSNGACGSRANTYSATDAPPYASTVTAWPTGSTWCASANGATGTPVSFPAQGATTANWTCLGANGGTNATCNASRLRTPTLTLSANPESVTVGGSSTLTWTPANATWCWASGDWSNIGTNLYHDSIGGSWKSSTGGTESTGALNIVGTYTYNMKCGNGLEETPVRTATVTVSAQTGCVPDGINYSCGLQTISSDPCAQSDCPGCTGTCSGEKNRSYSAPCLDSCNQSVNGSLCNNSCSGSLPDTCSCSGNGGTTDISNWIEVPAN